jgi:serine/threonine protein kinase
MLEVNPSDVKISFKILGSGKSKVHLGTFSKCGRLTEVAVKKIALKSSNRDYQDRTKWNELNNLRKAQHENVIKFYGHYLEENFHCLVLELAVCNLEEFLTDEAKRNDLQIDKMKILLDATHGLSAMHKKHIFHFDLKPENIFLVSEGKTCKAVLGDFGSSKENLKIANNTTINSEQLGTRVS